MRILLDLNEHVGCNPASADGALALCAHSDCSLDCASGTGDLRTTSADAEVPTGQHYGVLHCIETDNTLFPLAAAVNVVPSTASVLATYGRAGHTVAVYIKEIEEPVFIEVELLHYFERVSCRLVWEEVTTSEKLGSLVY